jgi:hypothetical protein
MKFTVAAAAVIALALAATTASAGVVITEKVDLDHQGVKSKTKQTVMIQGHKKKVITDEDETVTDLDARTMYIIKPKYKEFFKVDLPPTGVYAMKMVWDGATVGLSKATEAPHKVAGYSCQDYAGTAHIVRFDLSVIKCVASDAPGAQEFVEFQKAQAEKFKGTILAPKGEIPDGIPVASITKQVQPVWNPPPSVPPQVAANIRASAAAFKPIIRGISVTKIEVKDLPTDTFAVPAGYSKGVVEAQLPRVQIKQKEKMSAGGVPTAPAAAASAAPATH